MNLSPGSRFDHYEIIELIGKGGMGEVYRAKDTRLPRDAAIKVSAERFSDRFARESSVIASLNHPNICTLYDVGPNYLVMELVEGPTLADRINQGPLSPTEASAIARQIADALEYAHEKGVIHRDLKPSNIKIRPDGVVKLLDFGLAKVNRLRMTRSDQSTKTAQETAAGVILGTAAYLSPEQAMGREVDKRADIWAFGVVYYEMLSALPLYRGNTAQEIIASVLRDEPDYGKVPPLTHRLLKRCLAKDPQQRIRHIGDVMLLLDPAPEGAHSGVTGPPLGGRGKKWVWVTVMIAILLLIGIAVLATWAPRRSTGVGQTVRFELGPAEKMSFIGGGAMAVSPDGHWLVFPAKGDDGIARYWLRSLDTIEARALPGTETGDITPPASWSWDSRYVIFAANNKLQKVDIRGGPPQTLADVTRYQNGAAWNRDGVVVVGFFDGGPLLRVSASGGVSPSPVTTLETGETHHRWPQFLPDGRHFLYQRVSPDPKRMGVYIGSIDVNPNEQSLKRLLDGNWQAYFAASPDNGSGHLVFLRETTLMAQRFDPITMELSGEPFAIAEGVDSVSPATYGLFSVSETGTLVYRGREASRVVPAWFDQQGKEINPLGEPGEYTSPAVSPDGTRVAVALGAEASRDIWILDAKRGKTRVTFDPAADANPVWSPNGKNIVFSSNRSGQHQLYIKAADGSGEERLLFKSDEDCYPTAWSNDGRFVLFVSYGPKTSEDIWALPMQGDPHAVPILRTSFREGEGQFSPDGRWFAFTSSESGAFEIYVRAFSQEAGVSATGPHWKISQGTGLYPRWRVDGKELFYTSSNLQEMVVDIDTSQGFKAGTPRLLFSAPPPYPDLNSRSGIHSFGWDLAPDGKRFLFVAAPGGNRTIPFTVMVNWEASLKK